MIDVVSGGALSNSTLVATTQLIENMTSNFQQFVQEMMLLFLEGFSYNRSIHI